MTIKSSSLCLLLALVVLSRGLVPVGYMLNTSADESESGYLSLCPLQNPELNLGALYDAEEQHHLHHADSSTDLPSDSYNPISGLSECVLWYTAGTTGELASLEAKVIPVNEPVAGPIPVSPFRPLRFCCDAARAPPSFLS